MLAVVLQRLVSSEAFKENIAAVDKAGGTVLACLLPFSSGWLRSWLSKRGLQLGIEQAAQLSLPVLVDYTDDRLSVIS